MTNREVTSATTHHLPADLSKALRSDKSVLEIWEKLTPLARNEWICWVITVKRQKTRDEHIKRTVKELVEGKRRPCCWLGCIHRKDKQLSATQKWIIDRIQKN